MRTTMCPCAVRERLGDAATFGLIELLDTRETAMTERLLTIERFERRLAEEVGGLRVSLLREMHEIRSDTLKWAFLFWIGQVAVMAGLFAFMLRPVVR